jgi:hypothetical protein
MHTDLWHVGILHQPLHTSVETARAWPSAAITWLPLPGSFRFIADPFGIRHEGGYTLFVEALDYRRKVGEIQYFRYSTEWQLLGQGVALRASRHLSYPYLIEEGGHIYMLPEAHKSGVLTLYRAARFPDRWEKIADILHQPAIDATILKHGAYWWMFYALPGENHRAMRELHLAYAEELTGTWIPHPKTPVRYGRDSSRPGGTPFLHGGVVYLPTQDCTDGYGSAITLLGITTLTPEECSCSPVRRITPGGVHPEFPDGLHTLSSCGDVTLLDVKRVDHSLGRIGINWQRRFRRVFGCS